MCPSNCHQPTPKEQGEIVATTLNGERVYGMGADGPIKTPTEKPPVAPPVEREVPVVVDWPKGIGADLKPHPVAPQNTEKILDACCGSRMFWFNKRHPDTLYIDNRTMPPTKQTNGATIEVAPDRVMDFRNLDLPDNRFALVVFDPPHIIKRGGKRSYMKEKYGELERASWRDDLRAGFAELFRVLRPDGVLIFKWNETDIPLREVLALTPIQPLFGHRSGKAQKTHWVTFMKL